MTYEGLEALKGSVNQAQYEVAEQCYQALAEVLQSIIAVDQLREAKAQEALNLGLQALRVASVITEKLREVADAATSPEAEKFKRPPLQVEEEALFQALMQELHGIEVGAAAWYATNRERIDRVVSPRFRNQLFDTIRDKR